MSNKVLWILGSLILVGCSTKYCREPWRTYPKSEKASQVSESPQADPNPATPSEDVHRRVLVYKYDGSLQCEMGSGVSLDAMAKELKGITVYSKQRRHDGLMHAQVCGSRTGYANVYEISAKDLEEAQARKFQLWNF